MKNSFVSYKNRPHAYAKIQRDSKDHPALGEINLKTALDTIWEHERLHSNQITEMKQELV